MRVKMDGSNICESLKCQKPLEEDDVDLLRCQESFSDASLDCSVNKNNERTDIQANNKEQRDVHLETVRRDTVSKAKPKLLPLAADVYLRFSNDLRHGYRIFRELLSDQYKSIVLPFIEPVDVEAFGLKDYHERIKQPMDFWTINGKFEAMKYETITDVIADLRLIIENCYRYNGADHYVSKQAEKMEQVLDQKLALLSRNLREKTTLSATNIVMNKCYLNDLVQPGGRRRSARIIESSESSIMEQLKIEMEYEEKEMKRKREEEARKAEEALEKRVVEWDDEVLTPDVLHELTTTWEVPSVGLFIYLLKDQLNIIGLNYTEFELGCLFPRKSALLAKIFTSLLVTAHQRKRLIKDEPMGYLLWSFKVKTKVTLWYKLAASKGQEYAAALYGFDADFFDVLGENNPLDEFEFHDLSLQSRMWIMKALCEVALEQDSQMRDSIGKIDPTERQESIIGQDADGFYYQYFPQFNETDIRIYKHKYCRMSMALKLKQMKYSKQKARGRPKKEQSEDIPSFELVAWDLLSLKVLTEKFAEPKKKRGQPKIIRKPCEVKLYESLEPLLDDLNKREAILTKAVTKAKIKVMLECEKSDDPPTEQNSDNQESQTKNTWSSDNEDDEDEDTGDQPDLNAPISNSYRVDGTGDRQNSPEIKIRITGLMESTMKVEQISGGPQDDTIQARGEANVMANEMLDVKERKRRRTSPAERREGKIVNAHEAVDSSLSETVHVKDGQKTRHRRSNQLQYETIKYNSGEVRSKSDVTGLIKEERKVNKPKLAELYEASTMKVPGEDDVGITKEGRRARKRKFDVKELFADEIRKRSRKNKTREEAKLREENRLLKNESSTSLTSRDELIKDAMKHCVKLEVFDNNPQDLNCCHTRRKSVSKTETRCQNSELSNKSPEAVKKQFETMTKTVKFSPNAKDASEMPEFQKNFPKQCTSVSNSETSDQNMSNASPTKSPQAVKTCLRQCRTAQEIHTYNKNGPECFKYKAVVKLHRIDFCTKPVTGQVDKNESISGFVVEEMDHKARFDITDTCKHKHANLEQGLETFDKESKMERETVKEFKIGAEKQEKVNVELALDTVRKESEIEIREAPERDLFLDQDCGPDGIENINQSTYQQHIYEKYYEANIEADAVGRTCNFGENSDDNTIHGNCKQPEAEKEVEYKRISLNSRTNFNSEDDDQTTNSNLNNFPDIAVRRNCEEINGSVNAEQKVEAADCEQQKVGNEDRRQRISVESGLRLTSVDENQTTTSNQNNFADNAVRRNCGGISDSANAEEKVEATYCEQQKIENQERRHRISGLGSTSSGENQVATPNQSNILDNATVIIEGNAKRINISATTVHKVTSAAENFEETTNKVEDEQMSNLGNTEQRVTVAENTKSATEIIRENDEKISSSVNIEQKGTSAAENRITLSYKSNIAGNFSDTTEANTNLKQANVELGSETVDGELKIEANPVERQKYLDQYCEPTSVSSNEVTTNINEDEKSSAGTTHDKRNVTREDQVGQSEMSPDEDGETCKKQTNICKEQTLSDTPCDGEWLTKKVREIFPPCLEDSESEINGCKQSGRRTITISKQYLDNLGLTLSPEKSQHPDDCYETMDSSQTAFHEKNANVKAKSLGKSCSSSEGPGLLSHNKRCKRKRESLEDAKNFSSASENAGSISPSTSPPPQRAKLYSSGKLSPPIKFQKLDQANKSTCKKPSSPIDGKKSSCIKGSVEAEDLSSQSSSHAYDSLRALAEIATQSLQQGKSPSKLNLENLNVEGKIEGSNQEKGNLSLACLSNTAKTILKTALGDKFPVATVNRKKIQGFNPTHTRTVNTSSITSGKVRATQEVSGISKKIVNASKTTMQTSVPVVSHTNTATFSKSSPHPLNFAMRALVPRERPNILRKSNPGSAPKQQLMRRWKAAGVDPSHISAKPSPKKQLSFAANIGNVISISSHAVNVMKSFNDAFQNKSTKSGFFLLPVSQNNATNKNVAGTAPSLVSQTKETVKHGEPKNVSVVYKTANDKTGSLTNGGANSVLKTTMSLDTSNGMIKTASSRTWTNVPELVAESGKSSNFVPGSLASSKVDQMTKSCKTQSHKEVTVNEGKYLAVSNVLTGVPQQSSFSQPPVVKPNSSPVMLVSQVKFPTALEKTVSVSAGQIAHESVTGPLETGPTLVCQKLQTSLVLRTSPTSDTSEPWKHRINPEQNMLVPVSLATPPRSVLETMPTATGGQFPLVALHSTARTLKNQTQQLSVSPAQVEAASVNSQAQRAFAGIGHQKQRILVKVNNQTAKASTNVNSQVQKAPTNISNQVQKIPIANGTQIQVGPASVNCSAQLPPANVSSYVPKSTEGYRLPTQITPMNTGSQMCPKIGTGKSKSQAVISGQSQQGPGNVTSQVQKSLTNLTSQTQKASSGVTSQTHSLTIKGPANFINQTQQRLTNGNGKTQNGITNSNSQTQKDHTSSSNRTQQEIGAVSKQAQRIVNNQRQQQPAVVNRQTLKGKSIVSSHAYESFPGSDSHTQKVPSEIANQTKHGAVVSSSQPQKFVSNQAKVGTVCDSNAHVGHTNAKSQTQIDEILNGQAETVLTTINSYVQKELAANKVRKELATIFSQTRSRGTINAPSETQKRPPSISTHVLQGSLNASTEAPKGTASVDSQAKKASTNISTQVHKGPASVSEPPKRTVTVDSQAKKVPKNIDSKACKDPTNAISRTKKGPLSVNSDTEAESTSTNVWAHSGGDEQNRSTSTNKGLADFSNQAQKGSESGRHDSPVEVTNGHSETKREPTISSFEALKDSASVKSGAPKRTASAASKALKVPTSVTVQLCKESRSTVGLKEKGLVSVNGAETKESTSTNVSENKGLTHISNQTQKGLTSRDNETQKRRSSMSVQVQKGTVNVNSQTQKGMADASGEMKRVTADAKSQMRKQLSRISAAIQKCPRNASWRIQETSSKLLQQNQQELLNFNSQMKSFSVNVPAKGSLVSIVMPQPLSSLQSVYVPVSGLATHQKTNPTVLLTKRASSLTPAHSTPSGPFHTEGQLASTNTTNQCVSTTETLYVPVDKNQLTTSSFPIVGPVVSVQQVSHTVFNPTTATSKYSKEKTRTVEAIKEQIKQNTNSQEPSVSASRHSYAQPSKPTILRSKKPQITFKKM